MVLHPPGNDLSLSDPALLEKIDKLFACNVGSYVALPQLVVVGDQSSGKSSVLEGLTRLAFPRDSGLCTRFATQITFRRSVGERRIMASIIPSHELEEKDTAKLRSWKAKDLQSLDFKSFSQMMVEVHTLMGVSQLENDGLPTFSKHVLQVEIIGPKEEHLSVIDVPGIFSNAIPGKTTKEDKILVRRMVQQYMKNPRSIILMVAPANVDIATQEIVEMAHEVDPNGERTLGVLTKPDLVDKGAESTVIDIIKGKRIQVKLGWVIVRNPGQSELQGGIIGRDTAEEDLKNIYPWNTLDREDFGIIALKTRIRVVVTANARQAFTSVKYEISNSLKARQISLRSLGPPRKTMEQQGQFLVDVLSSFQNLTTHALLGNYSLSDAFEDLEILRLATEVAKRNEKFSDDVARWGHLFEFNNGSFLQGASGIFSKTHETQEGDFSSRNQKDIPELLEVLPEPSNLSPPLTHDLASWIGDEYRQSRGFEIGTFNPLLLSGLMKKQSLKWKALADGYIGDVIIIVHSYITNGLRQVCPDRRVYRNLLSFLMDRILERYQKAIDKTDHLLFIERSMTPMTLNHYLNDNIEKCRQKRATSMVASKAIEGPNGKVVRIDDLKFQQNMSNVEHVVQNLEDILQSYYKVARKRFVDNICMEACGYHLLQGSISPLELLTPSLVGSLSMEQLEEIAGEDAILKRTREKLHQEIAELSAAKKIML